MITFTSNRHPNDLYKGYGDLNLFTIKPLINCISNNTDIMGISSDKDYRRFKNLQNSFNWIDFPYFLTPNDENATNNLKVLWNEVTNNTITINNLTINVFGRDIQINCYI